MLKNGGHNKSDGGSIITDTTTNSESNLEIGGNLNLTSLAGDINVTGSKLNSDGNLTLAAADDVKIAAAQDTYFKEKTYHKEGLTVVKNSMSVNQTLTNVKSELNSDGDISITSGADTNLIGAKLNAENATINAGNELNIFSVADQNYSYATASKSRNFSEITKFVAPLLAPTAKLFEVVPVPVIGNMYIYANSVANNDFSSKSNLLEKNKITNQSSDINVVGNLTLTSNTDLNIKGSNLNGEETASVTSNTGDINIYNAVDLDYSRSESRSSKTTFASVHAGMIQATAAGISSTSAALDYTRTSDQKWKDIQANNEASKNSPQKTETHININSNETLISSNLIFNNINLSSTEKNTNITSSNLTSTNSTTITSGGSTNILTAVENDYTYTLNEKKTPSIAAALSNSVVKIFNDAMPSFGRNKSDNTDSNNEIDELVYDTDKSKVETSTKTNIASNIFSTTGDLTITSQNNNLISGSNLSAGNNVNITSNSGTTIITSAQDQSTTSTETTTQDYNDISANYNRGRASVDSTSNVTENTTTTTTTTQKQSTLSATNNITITSNKDLNILSSNISTDNSTGGAITLNSLEGNVNILALADTISKTSETKTGTLTLSAGIGNSHVDTAYAEYDLIQATKALADAKKNLNHMETLQKNGQASSDAVDDAKLNLTIATLNLMLAELKLVSAAAKSAASANSLWTGFYGDLRLSIAGDKANSTTNSTSSVASNINSNGNLIINSGLNLLNTNTDLIAGTVGNTTITGSNISSENGDINIESKNNTVINASKDTYNSSTITKAWESNITLGSTAGSGIAATLDNAINALQVSLSMSLNRSKSDTTSTTYHNSQLTAQNGNINVTSNGTTSSGSQTGGDTTISGGNILGQDVNITSNGNLTVESLQNSYIDKSKSFGLSLGGGTSNASGGINYSSNKTDRLWTDNQTSILGTNSVTINTTNNTEITGAVIANSTNGAIGENAIDGGNLTLNTKTLTFKNLEDHYLTENFGAGLSTSIGTGLSSNTNNQANPNPMQNLNFYPSGSTTLSLQNGSTKKEQTTFATLGNGTLNITDNSDTSTLNRDITKSQIITLDQITGSLDVNTTLDNRLFTATGRNQVVNEQKNLGSNLQIATKAQTQLLDTPLVTAANYTANVPVIGTVTSIFAGEGGSVATLSTQLLGLNYLLNSGNTRFQTNTINNLDNETLAKAIQGKDGFSLQQKSGYETEDGQKVNFFTITDKDGNSQTFRYTSDFKNLSDITLTDLINTKDYSLHGVDNTSDEAFLKGIMQLGTITNRTTKTENGTSESSFVTLNAPTKGLVVDGFENIYNAFFGKTPIASANVIQLQDFSQNLSTTAKDKNLTDIRMVGHSNGGDRLYLGILNGERHKTKHLKMLEFRCSFMEHLL